jgi:hypothetical protein
MSRTPPHEPNAKSVARSPLPSGRGGSVKRAKEENIVEQDQQDLGRARAVMDTDEPQATRRESLTVESLRKEHEYARAATNAEDHARLVSEHIRAIDEELEALSEERGRLARDCLKAAELTHQSIEKYMAVAKNDYRDPSR